MAQYMTPMGPTKLHVMPLFEIGPLEPRFSEWLVFEGEETRGPCFWWSVQYLAAWEATAPGSACNNTKNRIVMWTDREATES